MSSDVNQHVADALSSPEVVKGVSTITGITGAVTYLEWIPQNIGWVGTFIGVCMSLLMGYLAWKRDKRESKAFRQAEIERNLRIQKLEREVK